MSFQHNLESAPPGPDLLGDYANAFRRGQALSAKPSPASAVPHPSLRRAELYDAIGASLLAKPYTERRAILAHLAPALEREGIVPAVVARFDPTDEAIHKSMDSARSIRAALQAGEVI